MFRKTLLRQMQKHEEQVCTKRLNPELKLDKLAKLRNDKSDDLILRVEEIKT